MTIFEIDNRIAEILSQTDENGELPESAFDELAELAMDRDTKVENAACMYLDLVADAKKIREQELILADRRAALTRKAERILGYIDYATEGQPFRSERVDVRRRKTVSVEIDDDFWANPASMFVRQKIEADKTAIKAALKDGAVIPGAKLVEKNTISVK